MSVLQVDTIQDSAGTTNKELAQYSSGNWSWGSGIPAGSVLQVVCTPKTDTTLCQTANTLVTYHTATIQTKIANSKILVCHTVEYGNGANSYSFGKYYRTVSGDSDVQLFNMTISSHGTNSTTVNWSIYLDGYNTANESYKTRIKRFDVLDSPNKTSGTTINYVFKASAGDGGVDTSINRSYIDPGDDYRAPGCTTTVLYEIAP